MKPTKKGRRCRLVIHIFSLSLSSCCQIQRENSHSPPEFSASTVPRTISAVWLYARDKLSFLRPSLFNRSRSRTLPTRGAPAFCDVTSCSKSLHGEMYRGTETTSNPPPCDERYQTADSKRLDSIVQAYTTTTSLYPFFPVIVCTATSSSVSKVR